MLTGCRSPHAAIDASSECGESDARVLLPLMRDSICGCPPDIAHSPESEAPPTGPVSPATVPMKVRPPLGLSPPHKSRTGHPSAHLPQDGLVSSLARTVVLRGPGFEFMATHGFVADDPRRSVARARIA